MKALKSIIILLSALVGVSCADDEARLNVPPALVNVEINLSNIQYQSLRQIGGWIYLEDGHRGLIVYRKSQSEYLAWDRLCPNEPEDECGIVEVHSSGLYMEDPCCESTFDLDGYPTSGPAKFPLIAYNTFSDGTFLYISN